jgi:hypothetical protein
MGIPFVKSTGKGGEAADDTGPAQRARASSAARVVAAIVFVLTAVLLLAADAGPDQGVEISRKVETTRTSASAPTQITTTTEARSSAPDRSLLARAFEGGSASVIFRILIAVGVAFLAGAVVQRVMLGEYGFTIGPLSLPTLTPVSVEQAKEVIDLITKSPQLSSLLSPGGLRRSHPFPQYQQIEDDRLALISIRIELEERLRALAQQQDSIRRFGSSACLRAWHRREFSTTRRRRGSKSSSLSGIASPTAP